MESFLATVVLIFSAGVFVCISNGSTQTQSVSLMFLIPMLKRKVRTRFCLKTSLERM